MNPPPPHDLRSMRFRWWPLAVILLVGGGLFYAVQVAGISIVRPAHDFTILIGLLNVLLYVWVRAWSRLQKRAQLTTIAVVFAIQAVLSTLFRGNEFAGDGRIIFQWRWTPTPEQRLAEFSPRTNERVAIAKLSETHEFDSPSFRGTDRTGRYEIPDIDLNWNENPPRELWRHPVGRGWSSFAVVGDFCVTQEQRDSDEAVVCYELQAGKQVWLHRDATRFDEVTSGSGPRATPTIHSGRVFSFGATGILNCLDGTDGRVIWSHQFSKESVPLFGHSCSPLIHNNLVIVTPGGKAGSIVALHADTGEVAWSRDSRKPGYSSPHLFPTSDEDQILVFDATGLHAYEAETGDLRWTFSWGDNSDEYVNVGQPVILSVSEAGHSEQAEAQQLLISSGYGRGSAVISISRSASGEWSANTVWQAKSLKSKFSDVVVHEGYAYGLDEGILACLSLTDGTRRWKNGRYGYGQLILLNRTLLVQAESGRIALVAADPSKFTEVATLDASHDRTWNQPVVAGTKLLVRNDREAICFGLPLATNRSTLPEDDRR